MSGGTDIKLRISGVHTVKVRGLLNLWRQLAGALCEPSGCAALPESECSKDWPRLGLIITCEPRDTGAHCPRSSLVRERQYSPLIGWWWQETWSPGISLKLHVTEDSSEMFPPLRSNWLLLAARTPLHADSTSHLIRGKPRPKGLVNHSAILRSREFSFLL